MKLIESKIKIRIEVDLPTDVNVRMPGLLTKNCKYEDGIIHEICQLIDDGEKNSTIVDIILSRHRHKNFKHSGVSCLVSNIRSGDEKRYRTIAMNYNFFSKLKFIDPTLG